MKTRVLLYCILSMAIGATVAWFASSHTPGNPTFNVATYNIRMKNDKDSLAGNGWDRRAPYVAQLIQFHGFDIFGTQEGFKAQLEDLKKAMPNYEYIGVQRSR